MLDIFCRRLSEISTLDLEIGFRQFAITEESCWNIARDSRTLVRPSGRLSALLAVHLNFPLYTTRNAFDGETADVTSACPRLLICAGLSSENSFWLNTYSRRTTPEGASCQATEASEQWAPAGARCIHGNPYQTAGNRSVRGPTRPLAKWENSTLPGTT